MCHLITLILLMKVGCGVSQGYIRGPLLIAMCTNDLANASLLLFSLYYAGETNIFVTGTNIDSLISLMNTGV